MKHPLFEPIAPFGMGLFLVLTINQSFSASAIYPKHYEDIAIVYVANKKAKDGKNPTEAKGA